MQAKKLLIGVYIKPGNLCSDFLIGKWLNMQADSKWLGGLKRLNKKKACSESGQVRSFKVFLKPYLIKSQIDND